MFKNLVSKILDVIGLQLDSELDVLTSDGRYNPPHTINIRSFICRLHYSVLASIFLLFFQKPVHHSGLTGLSGKSYRIAKEHAEIA